jgi:hypothetical protein
MLATGAASTGAALAWRIAAARTSRTSRGRRYGAGDARAHARRAGIVRTYCTTLTFTLATTNP